VFTSQLWPLCRFFNVIHICVLYLGAAICAISQCLNWNLQHICWLASSYDKENEGAYKFLSQLCTKTHSKVMWNSVSILFENDTCAIVGSNEPGFIFPYQTCKWWSSHDLYFYIKKNYLKSFFFFSCILCVRMILDISNS
jgi:hypothetical protein